jgi:hypothetical protein
MATKAGVPVTARALVQRINRALSKDSEVLKATRGSQAVQDLGDFYVLDVRGNSVVRKDVDIEALGRKLGALRDFEVLV